MTDRELCVWHGLVNGAGFLPLVDTSTPAPRCAMLLLHIAQHDKPATSSCGFHGPAATRVLPLFGNAIAAGSCLRCRGDRSQTVAVRRHTCVEFANSSPKMNLLRFLYFREAEAWSYTVKARKNLPGDLVSPDRDFRQPAFPTDMPVGVLAHAAGYFASVGSVRSRAKLRPWASAVSPRRRGQQYRSGR